MSGYHSSSFSNSSPSNMHEEGSGQIKVDKGKEMNNCQKQTARERTNKQTNTEHNGRREGEEKVKRRVIENANGD